ncbi:MAG: helix-turn-helix transcriptional regulator [Bacteroidia bacterium]|nr:helix-turn-helix transcriptional regulator [Bacteroidia bacterium]
MAKAVYLSASHYSSLFRKKTGFSPIEYFNHLKVQQACQHLTLTDKQVKEIAFELGFDDAYYFTKVFTKMMHVTPHQYRVMSDVKLRK